MIATTLPKIVYGTTTLWLPRGFTTWECQNHTNNVFNKGPVYTQVTSYPPQYEIKCTTDIWCNTQDIWNGTNGYFLTEYLTFWNNWARLGKVFSFYRRGDDSTAGQSYFQYCVSILETDGIKRLIGNERFTLDFNIRTEWLMQPI